MKAGFRNYLDRTDLHGLKDTALASTRVAKWTWVVACLLAAIALIFQVGTLVAKFINEEFGSLETSFIPRKLPSALVCPWNYRFKDDVPKPKYMHTYMMGFFLMHRLAVGETLEPWAGLKGGDPEFAEAESTFMDWLKNEFNGSFAEIYKKKLVNKIDDTELVIPPLSSMKRELVMTTQGPCTLYECELQLSAHVAQHAWYRLKFKVNPELANNYKVYVGDTTTFGVFPTERDSVMLFADSLVKIIVNVYEHRMHPGRSGKRCRQHHDASDAAHIALQTVNQYCEGCKFYVPPSTHLNATAHPSGSEEYCNIFKNGYPNCVMRFLVDTKLHDEMAQKSMIPCVTRKYGLTASTSTMNDSSQTGVDIMWSSMPSGTRVEEYSKMSAGDFVAALGGSMGLFFGASVLSLVQCIVPLLECWCDHQQEGRQTDTEHGKGKFKHERRLEIHAVRST